MVTSFFNEAFIYFAILGVAALAGYISERVGIVNIGIEGQMAWGAGFFAIIASIAKAYELPHWFFIIGIIVAVLSSIFVSLLFGYLTIKLQADNTIAGTAINLLVVGLFAFITKPLGNAITNDSRLSTLYLGGDEWAVSPGSTLFWSSIIIFIVAVLIFVGIWYLINKTKTGLRMAAIGDNPNAVDAQGVSVNKYRWIGIIISGALAAFAGAVFAYNSSGFYYGGVDGLGFLALAIMIAGVWKPQFICVIALVFAMIFSTTISFKFEINSNILKTLPYIGTFVALLVFSRFSLQPKAAGKPFVKDSR